MTVKGLKREIIKIGKILYNKNLAIAKSGNISAKIDEQNILITASGTFLGFLKESDIIKVNLATQIVDENKEPSSELPLHSLIYKNFPMVKTVLHCHPPLTCGYFASCDSLEPLTFEARLYLGNLKIVPQQTPTVTEPEAVIQALRSNNLVVLKNHGVVVVGENFLEGLGLIEALEEAIKTLALAKLFSSETKDFKDNQSTTIKKEIKYPMFSYEHIKAIVDLVNQDEFIAQKGKELNLTAKIAIKLEGENKFYRFNFVEGKITNLDESLDAPFIISATSKVWEDIFLGKLDPFVATTQGKMKLEGSFGQLSKWYVPFSRLFQIFKQVKFI
ncbi:MAG: class II aldolase/adducin family protein [Candidatus Omnitrophica bacterium]|nr:class II aldolase/adducin family protein [Candidatus Omnitrophota bacterium]MCM8831753.1 class II aldolase/adducin family protein [Candidatus Omnitrophota bacterium]